MLRWSGTAEESGGGEGGKGFDWLLRRKKGFDWLLRRKGGNGSFYHYLNEKASSETECVFVTLRKGGRSRVT